MLDELMQFDNVLMRQIAKNLQFTDNHIVDVFHASDWADASISLLDCFYCVLLLGLLMLTEKYFALSATAKDSADDILVDSLMELASVAVLIVIRYF